MSTPGPNDISGQKPKCSCNAEVCKEKCPDKPCIEKRGALQPCVTCECTGPKCIAACEEKKTAKAQMLPPAEMSAKPSSQKPPVLDASKPQPDGKSRCSCKKPCPATCKFRNERIEEKQSAIGSVKPTEERIGICTCTNPCPKTCKNIKLNNNEYECPGNIDAVKTKSPPICSPCKCNVPGGCSDECKAQKQKLLETPCDPCKCTGPECKPICEQKKRNDLKNVPCDPCACKGPVCKPVCEEKKAKQDDDTPCDPCDCTGPECKPVCEQKKQANLPCNPCDCTGPTGPECNPVCEDQRSKRAAANNNEAPCETCDCTVPGCISVCEDKMRATGVYNSAAAPVSNNVCDDDKVDKSSVKAPAADDVPCNPCDCTVPKCTPVCEENKKLNPSVIQTPVDTPCETCDCNASQCNPACEKAKSALSPAENEAPCETCTCYGGPCNTACIEQKKQINQPCADCVCNGKCKPACEEDKSLKMGHKPCDECKCKGGRCNPQCEKKLRGLRGGNPNDEFGFSGFDNSAYTTMVAKLRSLKLNHQHQEK